MRDVDSFLSSIIGAEIFSAVPVAAARSNAGALADALNAATRLAFNNSLAVLVFLGGTACVCVAGLVWTTLKYAVAARLHLLKLQEKVSVQELDA